MPSPATSSRSRIVAVAALAPVAIAWLSAAVPLAQRPFRDAALNPASAVAAHDLGQSVRAIEGGASLTAAYPSPTPEDPARQATPLEEALRIGEDDLVRLFLAMGALPDPAERRRMACAEWARHHEDAAELLLEPASPTEVCGAPLQAAAQ